MLGNRNLRKKKKNVQSPATSLSAAARNSLPTLSRTGMGNGGKGIEGVFFFFLFFFSNCHTLCSKKIYRSHSESFLFPVRGIWILPRGSHKNLICKVKFSL